MTDTAHRVIAVVVLLVTGVMSLPLAAAVLDGQRTGVFIIPAQFLIMALIGAGGAVAVPALAPAGASPRRRALLGAGWGLLAAMFGLVVFWLLLNGFGGA